MLKKKSKKTRRILRGSRPEYATEVYQTWAAQVKKRDKNACQMPGCNRRKFGIEAHHIIKFADCPELRYDIMNGIALCAKCHRQVTGEEGAWATLFIEIVQANTLRQIAVQ